ncbi:MAG: hypothetical protein AAFO57_06100, partial [Pseudomonadota bacterium]
MLSNGPAFTEAAEQYRAERDRAERNRPRDYIHPLPKPPERIDQFQTPSGAQSLPPRERLVDKFIPFSRIGSTSAENGMNLSTSRSRGGKD